MKTLTEKQEAFLDALFGEAKGNAAEAVKMAGYAEGTATSTIVGALQEEIAERTRNMITSSSTRAVFEMYDLFDQPAKLGSKEIIAVAKDFLDRAGFSKTDKVEVKSASPLFILPPKDSN